MMADILRLNPTIEDQQKNVQRHVKYGAYLSSYRLFLFILKIGICKKKR